MIVLSREVFLCKCATDVAPVRSEDAAEGLRFESGSDRCFSMLDRAYHDADRVAEFRARLDCGEYWLVGYVGERIATYTWLHTRDRCEYPYLPGCAFSLPHDFAYGYDAWTAPALRGSGLRRAAFVEELRVLSSLGRTWEASFFVAYQLEGARRSLSRARVSVVPLWRVALDPGSRGRRLIAQKLASDDDRVVPAFPVTPVSE
jgi:hypothetical protein